MRRSDQMSYEAQRACGVKVDDVLHDEIAKANRELRPIYLITDSGGNTLDICTRFGEACRSQFHTKGARYIWRRGPSGGLEKLKIKVA